jgi:hypothetical protein
VPLGWNGTVRPALGAFMFIPGSLSYTNISASVTNQNYLMVQTIAPRLGGGLSGTNFALTWLGMAGVSYQTAWSTNLINWQPIGPLLPGTNGPMQSLLPLNGLPTQFFRVQATD